MSCGSHQRAAAAPDQGRSRDQWVNEKLEEVFYEFPADDLQNIRVELQTVKFSAVPSKQPTFKKMDRLLRTNQEVPAWLADSVRLLYRNSEFGDKLVERLFDLGYHEDRINNPALSYEERRPRMPMPEFIDGRDAPDMSEDYSPNDSDSNEADDEASDEAEEALSDSSVSGGDESEDDDLPVPSPSPRKSARPSRLRVSFSELLAVPNLTSSEESESVKEESGPDSSPRPIKEEDVTMGDTTNEINTTYTIGRVSSRARNVNRVEWSTSEVDDTDPDLDDDDVKLEEVAGSTIPDAAAPAGTDDAHARASTNGRIDRSLGLGGRPESPEAMVHSPANDSPPRPRLRRKGRFSALGTPRPVSNMRSFLNDIRDNEMRPEASGENEEMAVEASPSPIAEESEEERVKGPKGKEVIVISSSSSGQLPKSPKGKKKVGKKFLKREKNTNKSFGDIASSPDSSPLARSNRAKPKSKLAKLVKKLYVKRLKKMRKSRDRELKRRAAKTANANTTGSNRGQETAATAPTSGNGSPTRLEGNYGERPARAAGMFSSFSSLLRNGRRHGAAASSASRSGFHLSRRDKETNVAENSGSLGDTDPANYQAPQVQAGSAVSDSPANPAGVVKRKPGRPVGSGLLRDKKLLEPTRLSKRLRLRLRSTSTPILQASQDNTANAQQAMENMPSSPIDANPRDLDATAESSVKRKRGRPVGSTEAYLLARGLQADIVKNEPPSSAEGSPSKRRRTVKY